jgi:hypothetical protein
MTLHGQEMLHSGSTRESSLHVLKLTVIASVSLTRLGQPSSGTRVCSDALSDEGRANNMLDPAVRQGWCRTHWGPGNGSHKKQGVWCSLTHCS